MTTAHRPTFDAARAKDNSSAPTRQYSSRSLPAHKTLKYRSAASAVPVLDDAGLEAMRIDLERSERAHFSKPEGQPTLLLGSADDEAEAKRRRIIEDTKDLDADASSEDESEESSDEDEAAELMRELAKIKQERADEEARKAADAADEARTAREAEIAFGNPLLNPDGQDFLLKRRWDEDVVFRVKENEAGGKKDFVNDLLRSDFHRSFMKKYVR